MGDKEIARYWNENAKAWTELSRAGYDIYRDYLNTPFFFSMMPHINGLIGIDIGCGEGHNTRLLAERGAMMHGIDISEKFIEYAKNFKVEKINYLVASASSLPFEDASFDFATSFMCLMDLYELDKALNEVYRTLKPNGFLQFSIAHPCFATPHRRNLRDFSGRSYAIEVGDYFKRLNGKVDEWIFGKVPTNIKDKYAKFRIPLFNRTLTQWVNSILNAGFKIEQINEPYADAEMVKKFPELQDTQVVGYFLHIRCRKQ